MKRHIQSKISAFVAASMIFGMLSPAISAHAAVQPIKFDTGIYKDYEGSAGELPQLSKQASATVGSLRASYPDTTAYPADTGSNGQDTFSIGADNIEMPWWNVDWSAYASGSGLPATKPSPFWGGKTYDFRGYALEGWYAMKFEDDVTQARTNKLPKMFPTGDSPKVYYARYVSDGTEFAYRVNHTLPVSHSANSPIAASKRVKNASQKVLARPEIMPYNVQGYTVSLPDSNIKMYKQTLGLASDLETRDFRFFGFDIDADKNVTGVMTNRPMEVSYVYTPDPTKKFGFNSEHQLLKKDGSIDNTLSYSTTARRVADSDVISTVAGETNPGPDTSLISAPAGQQARYILVKNDGAIDGMAGLPAEFNAANTGNLKKPYFIAGTDASEERNISAYNPASLNTSTWVPQGKMPNQAVRLVYTYYPNPNYRLNIKVSYKDSFGESMLAKVQAADTSVSDTSIAAAGSNIAKLTDGFSLEYKVSENSTTDIAYPDLSAQGYTKSMRVVEGVGDIAVQPDETVVAGKLRTAITSKPITIEIIYTKTAANWQYVTVNTDGRGQIYNAEGYIEGSTSNVPYRNDQTTPERVNFMKQSDASGEYIELEPEKLPIPVPSTGYEFKGYYVNGSNTLIFSKAELANASTPVKKLRAPYSIVAKFEKASGWKKFTFKMDSNSVTRGSMSPAQGRENVEVYPKDALGALINIPWSTLRDADPLDENYGNLVPTVDVDDPLRYEVAWYRADGTKLEDNTNMSLETDGATFTAWIVPKAGTSTLNTPNSATTAISDVDGVISINVPNTDINANPAVKYAVVNANGKVVSLISSRDLQTAGGKISSGVLPGMQYQLYEVAPSESISLGDDISTVTDKSAPLTTPLSTPVAVTPVVTNSGAGTSMTVEIRPVTPGISYAVVDDNGVVKHPWTIPGDDFIRFAGLTAGETYHIVAKPSTASGVTETSRMPGLSFVADAAQNRNTITVVADDIATTPVYDTVVPAGLDLNNIATGAQVTIKAKALNDAGESFRKWEIVSGAADSLIASIANNQILQFTMPRGNIVLAARYGTPSGADWNAPVQVNNAVDTQPIVVSKPNYGTAPDKYRIVVYKETVPTDVLSAIEASTTEEYHALWMIKLKVQKEVAGNWVDDNSFNSNLLTTITTGTLNRDSKKYTLHEIDMAATSGLAEIPETDAPVSQINQANNYIGSFSINADTESRYVFGYKREVGYRVIIKDTSNNNAEVTGFTVPAAPPKSLSDYEDDYEDAANNNRTDNNGITWTYQGVSTSDTSYVSYNVGAVIASDLTLYLYYTHDRVERGTSLTNLRAAIAEGRPYITRLTDATLATQLQNAIDAADLVVTQNSPRRASKSEIDAVLAPLAALNASARAQLGVAPPPPPTPPTPPSGGSSSSSSSSTTTIKAPRTLDMKNGNWSLTDAQKGIWQFRKSDNQPVTGWVRLAYTYNGLSRTDWYHFNSDGNMDTGWFFDSNAFKWYYLNEEHDGFFGAMKTGWFLDKKTDRWYYLDERTGEMRTGWIQLAGKWYYLAKKNEAQRPEGSLYTSTTTPDGYRVDVKGEYIK